jgi:hypothetical protein
LPASFFEMPGGVKVQQVIVVDMLADYYLGYRTFGFWRVANDGRCLDQQAPNPWVRLSYFELSHSLFFGGHLFGIAFLD